MNQPISVPRSQVAVIGAGVMGAQIGAEYALAGFSVRLCNRSLESSRRARGKAVQALATLVALDLVEKDLTIAATERLTAVSSLEAACLGAEIVIESISEDLEAKADALGRVARLAPNAILVTNTSSIRIEALGRMTDASPRLIGNHYWNPPILMPLVEVIPGPHTAPRVTRRMKQLLIAMGKEPVLAPDIPGFIWNRLQFALLREAANLVRRYRVEPSAIDLVVSKGLGRRLSTIGPFQTMSLGGQATFRRIGFNLFPELSCETSGEVLDIDISPPDNPDAIRQARDAKLAAFLKQDRIAGGR